MENILVADVWTIIISYLEEDSANNIIAFKGICKYSYDLIRRWHPNNSWSWNQLDMIFEQSEDLFFYYYNANAYKWDNNNINLISYMLGRTGNNSKIVSTLIRDKRINATELLFGAVRSSNNKYISDIIGYFKLSLHEDDKEIAGNLALSSCNIECFKHLMGLGIIDISLESICIDHIAEPYIRHEKIEENYEFDVPCSEEKAIEFLGYLMSINPNLYLSNLLSTAIYEKKTIIISHLLTNHLDKLEITPGTVKDIIKIGNVDLLKLVKHIVVPLEEIIPIVSSSISMIEYFCQLGIKPLTSSYLLPIKRQRLDIVKYLYGKGVPVDNTLVVQSLSYYDNNEILHYLFSLGLTIPNNIYSVIRYLSNDVIKYLTLTGIPPTQSTFQFLLNEDEEETALEVLKLCESKGYIPPQDISKSYLSPDNKDCLVLKYLVSKGYPAYVSNIIDYVLGTSRVIFDFLLMHVPVTYADILKLFKYNISSDICLTCINAYGQSITNIYNDVTNVWNLNMILVLERMGICAPKYILDKVHYLCTDIVSYFIFKCYPVSKIQTMIAIKYIDYPDCGGKYLRCLWDNTDYEFDAEITEKLTNIYGERSQTLDVIMRDYIADL